MLKRMGIAFMALAALSSVAFAQQGVFPNYPIVGGAAYCSSRTNGVCTNTVPAGPTALTGNEQIPANTELANGTSPQNVLVTPASLNALPMVWNNIQTTPTSASISASNIQGGVFFISGSTISAANVTLPLSARSDQQFRISANATITKLTVTAPAGDTMGTNAAPTVLTVSTTAPQGYLFVYHSSTKIWHRFQ